MPEITSRQEKDVQATSTTVAIIIIFLLSQFVTCSLLGQSFFPNSFPVCGLHEGNVDSNSLGAVRENLAGEWE